MEDALGRLTKILTIVSEDSKLYYLKKPSEIDDETLKKISLSFLEISSLLEESLNLWGDSRFKGPDAIQPSADLKERIDFKLFESGKLDFEQMKKIMKRLHRMDNAVRGLDRIGFYIKYYRDLCKIKKLDKYADLTQLFITSNLDTVKETMLAEGGDLKNQIERCNLYYQSVINTKTLWVAICSLIVSSLAFLLTILNALHFI